jgi:hypothetical protein
MRRQTGKRHANGVGNASAEMTVTYLMSVAGVSFDNDDGSSRQTIISSCKPGETLRLIREPDNKFDPRAIKVVRGNGRQVGYLPARITCDGDPSGLAHQIGAGVKFRCRIVDITGGGPGMLYGIEIEITDGKW